MKKVLLLIIIFVISFSLYSKERTVAISYFDNTSGIKKYEPLTKGIVDMLITDLSSVKSIRLVEREKLEQLLKEIKLGKSKYFDNKTAQKLGKGLGAEVILTGSFIILNRNLRIDARLIEVETGQILLAKQVTGNKNDFFDLHKKLAMLLIQGLKINNNLYKSKYKKTEIDFNAVVDYSKALNFKDQGKNDEAKTLLEETLQEYPDFKLAKNKLEQIQKLVSGIEKIRPVLQIKEVDDLINKLDIGSPNITKDIMAIWSKLSYMKKQNKIIQFTKYIRSLKIDLNIKMEPHRAWSLDEWLYSIELGALDNLKKYNLIPDKVAEFVKKYPGSHFFETAKIYLNRAVKGIDISNNKGNDIEKEKFLYFVKFFNKFGDFRENYVYNKVKIKKPYLKANVYFYLSKEVYDKFKILFKKNIIKNAFFEIDYYSFNAILTMFDMAILFEDYKFMNIIKDFAEKNYNNKKISLQRTPMGMKKIKRHSNRPKKSYFNNQIIKIKNDNIKKKKLLIDVDNICKTRDYDKIFKFSRKHFSKKYYKKYRQYPERKLLEASLKLKIGQGENNSFENSYIWYWRQIMRTYSETSIDFLLWKKGLERLKKDKYYTKYTKLQSLYKKEKKKYSKKKSYYEKFNKKYMDINHMQKIKIIYKKKNKFYLTPDK